MNRLLFTLLFLCTAIFAQDAVPVKDLIFCTYNVRNYVGDDQVAPPDRRARPKSEKERDAVVAVIRDINPDVLGICEMGSEKMFEEFKERLAKAGLKYEHSEYLQAGDPDRHLALVSRYPIVARNSKKNVTFEINGTTEEMKRGILDVTVQVTPNYQLRCVGVHLKSKLPVPQGEAMLRRLEAMKLREHLDAIFKETPVANIICYGDFNDTKNEPMFQEVTGVKGSTGFMTDLWARDSLGDRWTHYWRTADEYARIDYIFVSQGLWPEVQREKSTIYRSPYWFDASDHRAVYTTITPVEQKP